MAFGAETALNWTWPFAEGAAQLWPNRWRLGPGWRRAKRGPGGGSSWGTNPFSQLVPLGRWAWPSLQTHWLELAPSPVLSQLLK